MNLWVPQNAGNFMTSWRPVRFSERTLLHAVMCTNNLYSALFSDIFCSSIRPCCRTTYMYKVVQIWPGLCVCKQVTVCPGHIWTTLYYTALRVMCKFQFREDTLKLVGRYSSVGIATRYGRDGPGIESRLGWDFPHPSRPAVGPTQPPIQWVPDPFPGVKAAGA